MFLIIILLSFLSDYATTNDHFSYSDDDDVGYMRSSDSSDDNIPAFRPRPRSKYCDLLSGRSVSSSKFIIAQGLDSNYDCLKKYSNISALFGIVVLWVVK